MNKSLIDYLTFNNGKLKGKETWYQLGLKFGIEPPDKERAEKDKNYKKKSIRTRAQDIWRDHLKQRSSLELKKETYIKGELYSEVYSKKTTPNNLSNVDLNEYEIERLTTNPNGGAWLKYKKKDIINDDSHQQDLLELLKKEIEPVKYNYPLEEGTTLRGMFVYTSDKHIGALTKEDSIYKNKYDREEIKSRLIDFTLLQIEKNRNIFGNFDSLFMMDLGDALDGFNQKTTGGLRGSSSHTLPQQMDNREQHDFYVEIHKELFDIIVERKFAKDIYFIATSNSNHGGDFEYGAMKNLETYLNVKYPFIKTCINAYSLNHFFYGQHCFIFGHGKDSEDMKNGLPLNINDKVEVYINDYITKNKLEKYQLTVVTGDLHQSSENYGKNFRYRKVLSQYGSSKWMHTNFGSGSPGLSYEVVEKNGSDIFKADKFICLLNESNTGLEWNI